MLSYAQNFEDVMLRRALQDIEIGFYVDIGAFDPVVDSVTAWFYRQGWSGVNVEPSPGEFARLVRQRPRDINMPICVGSISGSREFVALHRNGLSSARPGAREELERMTGSKAATLQVDAASLADVLKAANGRTVDFLKVDVEGLEDEVLRSAEFDTVRPRIIVVEATLPTTQVPSHEEWEPHLLERGYEMVYFDGSNRFYVRSEDAWRRQWFALPPNNFDNFHLRSRTAEADELLDRIMSRVEGVLHDARFAVAERRWRRAGRA